MKAEQEAAGKLLLAMGRAVQTAGMYGAQHPSTRSEVDAWFRVLAPVLRSRGTVGLASDGRVISVNSRPSATTNPVILSLAARLHAVRAGHLEILSGLKPEDARHLVAYLANVDEHGLVEDDDALDAWIEKHHLRHLRVRRLVLREVKDGDVVVSRDHVAPGPGRKKGGKGGGDAGGKAGAEPSAPQAAATWAEQFKKGRPQEGPDAPLDHQVRDGVVAALRGESAATPEQVTSYMISAAAHVMSLAAVLLKTALVKHELAHAEGRSLGEEVVGCLRTTVAALRRAPDTRTEEGWHILADTVAGLAAAILDQVRDVAGGTDEDTGIIHAGARDMLRDIEGTALALEYQHKRGAFQEVEARLKRFFSATPEGADHGA